MTDATRRKVNQTARKIVKFLDEECIDLSTTYVGRSREEILEAIRGIVAEHEEGRK